MRLFFDDDTIAAIATAPGEAGIGVIRVSGPQALALAERVFRRKDDRPLESHRIYYGEAVHPETAELLDDALLFVFVGPHSYTGEDTIELSCHGGSVTLRRVLEACLTAGARPAEPGEFTQRAFMNGRLDLSQAEAVADLIAARTDAQQRLALRQRGGALSREVGALADRLMGVLAHIEATIDFSEDIGELDYAGVSEEVREVHGGVGRLLLTAGEGRIVREGLRVAIVGRPNVGKSSLMNALLGRDRAIVTPIAGTTRDVIEEYLNLNGVPVVLSDTAGVRDTHDEVEAIGVQRTRDSIAEADLALFLFDASEGLTEDDRTVWNELGGKQSLAVANKTDLVEPAFLNSMLAKAAHTVGEALPVSASTGDGLPRLQEAVWAKTVGGESRFESVMVSNARHQEALRQAEESLALALESLKSKMPPDFVTIDLRGALDALGLISGATVTEDIIERIFRDFCIGK